ncbi:hypothetical protein FP74_gp076 [Bacillus phage CAM003]|uniref:Uncharacterized protein n=2 Tax=Bastillevirus TaxID=1918010 RepID=A0A024B3H9_9CAUD|nr:hypothetical protein FP73_gp075 [Bacillus phage Hoody T]YP_009037186.1 hypothetical protein FP74_gp076 [Bacillus phage CAM003]AHZ09720.1 hypothetical protein [Bacillus phage CAM003]AHZ10578.1 hypothetical protein [Bacillus phage Hoody T]
MSNTKSIENVIVTLEDNLSTVVSTKILIESRMDLANERKDYYRLEKETELENAINREVKALYSHLLTLDLQTKQLQSVIKQLKGAVL